MAQYEIGQIEISCNACGSKEMAYEEGMDDASNVRCSNCGADLGTVGGLRAAALATAKSKVPEIADALKKVFKF